MAKKPFILHKERNIPFLSFLLIKECNFCFISCSAAARPSSLSLSLSHTRTRTVVNDEWQYRWYVARFGILVRRIQSKTHSFHKHFVLPVILLCVQCMNGLRLALDFCFQLLWCGSCTISDIYICIWNEIPFESRKENAIIWFIPFKCV